MVAEVIRFPIIARPANDDAEVQRLIDETDAALRAARRELKPLSRADKIELDCLSRVVTAGASAKEWLMGKADQAGLSIDPPLLRSDAPRHLRNDLPGFTLMGPVDPRNVPFRILPWILGGAIAGVMLSAVSAGVSYFS